MDVIEAINKRKSIRAFKPDPVLQQVLKEIMELSLRAPSWGNCQPWEFAIACGEELAEIKRRFREMADEPMRPDLQQPKEFPEPLRSRRRATGIKVLEVQGIGREDKERRKWWNLRGLALFDAPCVIYILIDRSFCFQDNSINVWPVFDSGLAAENIMLAATNYGLGTIAQIQAAYYPDILRQVLAIPDSKLILLGIAVGYPDWNSPLNQFRTDREAPEKLITWHGFTSSD